MIDLAAQFARSGTDVLRVGDKDVRTFLRLQVENGTILELTRLTASRTRPQAIRLEVSDGLLIASSTRANAISLWSDTAPRKVRVRVECETSATVDLWNAWRYAGIEHSWTGNAGLVVQRDQRKYTLQCSDGIGDPDFTDLVLTLHVLAG